MDDNFERRSELHNRLEEVREQQYENKRTLVEHEELEQQYTEITGRSRFLFDALQHQWHRDHNMASMANELKSEVQHRDRQVLYELVDRKKDLLHKQQDLYDEEEMLYGEMEALRQEE